MADANITKTLPALTVEQANATEDAIYEIGALFANLESLNIDSEEPHITATLLRAIAREGKKQVSEAIKPLLEAKVAYTSREEG